MYFVLISGGGVPGMLFAENEIAVRTVNERSVRIDFAKTEASEFISCKLPRPLVADIVVLASGRVIVLDLWICPMRFISDEPIEADKEGLSAIVYSLPLKQRQAILRRMRLHYTNDDLVNVQFGSLLEFDCVDSLKTVSSCQSQMDLVMLSDVKGKHERMQESLCVWQAGAWMNNTSNVKNPNDSKLQKNPTAKKHMQRQ